MNRSVFQIELEPMLEEHPILDAESSTTGVPLLPPRPNPGPEPWSEPPLNPWPWLALLGAVLVLGTMGWWLRRRWRAHRLRSAAETIPIGSAAAVLPQRERMTLWAGAVRTVLVEQFGPTWGAKTTEEIAAEPTLAARFGPELAAQLLRFLAAADRAKFGAEANGTPQDTEDWEPWVKSFLSDPTLRERIGGHLSSKD